MFKKKNKIQKSGADYTVDHLWEELSEHSFNLRRRVEDAYIKNLAVAIYPEGADKCKALTDLDKAQELVLASIAHYDTTRNQCVNFLKDHKEELIIYADVTGCNWEESHAVVEKTIRNFIKK